MRFSNASIELMVDSIDLAAVFFAGLVATADLSVNPL